MRYPTRAQWLAGATKALRPAFRRRGWPLPRRIFVAPESLAPIEGGGTAWGHTLIAPGAPPLVSIEKRLRSIPTVLATLIHELCHVARGQGGHDADFTALLDTFGIDDKAWPVKWTSLGKWAGLGKRLGPYPPA